MELFITIGAVLLVVAALCIVKEVIVKMESGKSKNSDIREKFQQLNKMAAQMKV